MHLTDKQCQQLINDSKSIIEHLPKTPVPLLSYEEVMGNIGRTLFSSVREAVKTAAPGRE